jgi:hypothetical protein
LEILWLIQTINKIPLSKITEKGNGILMLKKTISILCLTTLMFTIYGYYHYSKKVNVAAKRSIQQETKLPELEIGQDEIFVDSFSGEINIYLKTNSQSDKYVAYHIKHSEKSLNKEEESSNFDVWNLTGVNEVVPSQYGGFRNIEKIVTTGEWELALKEKGASDFIGGTLHGDEITTSLQMEIDGEQIEVEDLTKKSGKTMKFTTVSDLYRDNTISEELTKIGLHKKTYIFDKDGLTIEQNVEFLEDLSIEKSYLAMLPILRKSNGENGKQITDTVKINKQEEEYSVADEDFDIPEINAIETSGVSIFGKDSSYRADVDVISKSPDFPTIFHVANDVSYNKLYFAFNEGGQNVTKGDTWEQETRYEITAEN